MPVDERTEVLFLLDENKNIQIITADSSFLFQEQKPDLKYYVHKATPWQTLIRYTNTAKYYEEIDAYGKAVGKYFTPLSKQNTPTILLEGASQSTTILSKYDNCEEALQQIFTLDSSGTFQKLNLDYATQRNDIFSEDNQTSSRLCITRDGADNYWVAFGKTVLLFDKDGRLVANLRSQIESAIESDWYLTSLFIDRAQNVWLTTSKGVVVLSRRANPFSLYLTDQQLSVRGMQQAPDGRLLVTTEKGNYFISTDGHSVTAAKEGPHFLGITRLPNKEFLGGTSGPRILHVQPDQLGNLTWSHQKPLPTGSTDIEAELFYPYHDVISGSTYCGSSLGLFLLKDVNHDSMSLISLDPERSAVEFINRTSTGLYLAGAEGLSSYDPATGITLQLEFQGHRFKHFHEDAKGIFWIATSGAGLLRWDPVSRAVKQYTTSQGLTNNVLYAVYEDEQHMLWLPSNRGLMSFDPLTENLVNFQPEDGIAHEEFNTFSHYRDKDGKLYFGGLDGLTAFFPDSIYLKNKYQPLQVTGLSRFNDDLGTKVNALKDYRREGRINITPSDRMFNVSFALQDYASGVTDYAWRLEPDNHSWTYQKEHNLVFYGLPPGEHQLVIKARGTMGDWSSDILRIPIYVQPPLYLRPPFQLLIISLLILTVWVYVSQRTLRLRKEKEKLRDTVERRTAELHQSNKELTNANQTRDRLFALISHDLRTPLIAMRNISRKVSFLIERGRHQEVAKLGLSVDKAINSTQTLLNNLLSWSMIQLETLPYHPKTFEIDAILASNKALYQTAADHKGVQLCVSSPTNLKGYADPIGMATILRNLTDNAIKFTPPGESVRVIASSFEKLIHIEVHDTGSGFSLSQQQRWNASAPIISSKGTEGETGVGLGLALCRDLAKINQGALVLLYSHSEGTGFQISLPIASPQLPIISD
jgi:signal transduction histidine kinase/streptogramin lyase